MLENLKSLFIILSISIPIFWIVKPAFVNLLSEVEFKRYRNLWLLITLILFLANNFWLYMVLVATAILLTQMRERNKVALYFMLLFVMPPVEQEIGGLGMIEYLFVLNPTRLLELSILLPAALAIMRRKDGEPFGKSTPDKLLAGYILLMITYRLIDSSFTNAMRNTLYIVTDVFLPYYVISRSLRDINQFKVVFATLTIAVLLLSGAALYEYTSLQLLYSGLGVALGADIGMSTILMRGDLLRALVTTGQPIALGFVVMVGLGFYLFLLRDIPQFYRRGLMLALLAGGLFASLSRGPWIGMVILLVMYIYLRPRAIKNLILLFASGMLAFMLALNLPGGDKLIDLLPFVGHVDSENVEYRQRLFDRAVSVISRNPIFGSNDYRNTPEMRSMIQGQGIIDIVNSYLGIALDYGLTGLGLFISFFVSILWGVYRVLRQYRARQDERYLFGVTRYSSRRSLDDEHYLLGATLFSVLTAILITIYTVSSISVIPAVYWAVAGMCVAYIQMMRGDSSPSVQKTVDR